MNLPQIQVWHTSDLTERCPRAVLLRHSGMTDGVAPTALVRGCIVDEALGELHTRYRDPLEWPSLTDDVFGLRQTPVIVARARDATLQRLYDERRTLSPAAARDCANGMPVFDDVVSMVDGYIRMFYRFFSRCELIGAQVPIELRYGGRVFASHLDLVFRAPSVDASPGELCIWDWKCRQDAPGGPYLVRHAQMILYWFTGRYGRLCVDPDFGLWQTFGEWPAVTWVHLPACKPYTRKGSVTNEKTGEVREWKKGDARPIEAVLKRVHLDPDATGAEAEAWSIVEERIKLADAGLWPMIPDPIGCGLCGSRQWCGGVVANVPEEETYEQ